METSRRMIEKEQNNTYMSRVEVVTDVAQVLPNGNYVLAHTPTRIKIFGHEVPQLYGLLRSEQEKQWLVDAQVEYEKRKAKYLEEFTSPEEKEKALLRWPETVQSVMGILHIDAFSHPVLSIKHEYHCGCGEVYFAERGNHACPKCSEEGKESQLPPPKQIEQYNANNQLITQLLSELIPKMQAQMATVSAEAIRVAVEAAVESKMEDYTGKGKSKK